MHRLNVAALIEFDAVVLPRHEAKNELNVYP